MNGDAASMRKRQCSHSLPILAENFDNVWVLVLGLPAGLTIIAALSLFPSARGMRRGPILAGPVVVIGVLLFFATAAAHATAGVLARYALPIAVGICSISLWSSRRDRN